MRLHTRRLLLRRWLDRDREPFAALNADTEVMEHFPSAQDRASSDALVDRIEKRFGESGYGLWALERLDSGRFVGFTGLCRCSSRRTSTPAIEVGWRLERSACGHGFATEAATAAVGFGFDTLGLTEIVSVTAVVNQRSQAVMRRLGMRTDPAEDFDHPSVLDDDRLRRHVLYRITAEQWATRSRS